MEPLPRLPRATMRGMVWNITDQQKFENALQLLKESMPSWMAETLFCSDNLITWNRNLSFLRDPYFVGLIRGNEYTDTEKTIVWRSYVLLYFAKICSFVEGDFVELGCHTGSTAIQVIQRVDFEKIDKKYYLYDLFSWNEGDQHERLQGHNDPNMYENVKKRFCEFDFVKIIRGSVPESFKDGFPDKIAFCHIDMNHPAPEIGSLKEVLPRLQKGGAIIFDDYGWWGYSAQKIGLDPIASEHGLEILELPTGQGLLIKPC